MKCIYNKNSLKLCGSIMPDCTFEQEIELNVIPNYGGTIEDYSSIETEETSFHLEIIDDIVTVVRDIIIPIIPPKTELELLQEKVDINTGAIDFIVMNF